MTSPTPREFFEDVINVWEDAGGKIIYSDDPHDPGNWVGSTLVGSQHGVTPAAFCAYKGMHLSDVTRAVIQSITLEEAADIAVRDYYHSPGFDKLTWCPATAAMCDFGWNAGQRAAARHIQSLCGAEQDCIVGPETIGKWNAWIERLGWDASMDAVHAEKLNTYRSYAGWALYGAGWTNRVNYCSRQNSTWYNRWVQGGGVLDTLLSLVRP
jgi:lysozyme family protein